MPVAQIWMEVHALPCGVLAVVEVAGRVVILLDEGSPAAWPAALTAAEDAGIIPRSLGE